jgi:hypothetical protein
MKKLPFAIISFMLLLFLSTGCFEDSDCGGKGTFDPQIFTSDFFTKPSEIYWGESGGIRSFTYNFTIENICPEENPKVQMGLYLKIPNTGSDRPVAAKAGVQTCFGVQATQVILVPNDTQHKYESASTEIGMNQCFGGQSSATIYPYITLSFNTLGSSQADSVYLDQAVSDIWVDANFNKPK